jgi:hypothetical protein
VGGVSGLDPDRGKRKGHDAILSRREERKALSSFVLRGNRVERNKKLSKASPGTAPDAYPPALSPGRVTTLCFREVGTADHEGRADSKPGYFQPSALHLTTAGSRAQTAFSLGCVIRPRSPRLPNFQRPQRECAELLIDISECSDIFVRGRIVGRCPAESRG